MKICDLNLRLYGITIIINIMSFLVGFFFAWTSPAIPKLKTPNEYNPLDHVLTSEEESWLASLMPLGAATSTFISGYAADKIGRKSTLFFSSLITTIGILLSIIATGIRYLYLSRFFSGLGAGTVFTVIPVFVGEISEINNRGILGCVMVLAITLGIVCTYIIGPIISLIDLSYLQLSVSMTFSVFLIMIVPESPYFYVQKDKYNNAYSSLRKLRVCDNDRIVNEFEEIRKSVQVSLESPISLGDILKRTELFRGIIITCSLVMFQQLSGVNVILFFLHSIFKETGSTISPDSSAITIGIVQALACTITSIFVDRLGRKILMLISCIGGSLSLTSFGIYFYLKETNHNVTSIYWLPILSIVFFMIAYSLGLGPIPFVVLSEIFPTGVRFLASTITIFVCLLFTFCTTTFFPRLIEFIGMAYTFWMLAVFCFIGATFVFGFLPETKGKTFQEIQEILRAP
ncbi:facilitated trehalose transporter Tret1-like [Onthophagus taurus]|uniref:facilitated trehalose transporter Tret1-like n=1 Tax=Onthophagus taurus TaxID=166361 RepID=UPI0039BE4236